MQTVVGDRTLGEPLREWIASSDGADVLREGVAVVGIPAVRRLEDHANEALAHDDEELSKNALVAAARRKLGWSDEDGGAGLELAGHRFDALERRLDDLAVAETFLTHLARTEQRELEPI